MFRSNAPASDIRSAVEETQPPIRILVIGAGYAGLLFTMRLAGKVARQHVQIALVNESDTFKAASSPATCVFGREALWLRR
jgi:hypothetical protein